MTKLPDINDQLRRSMSMLTEAEVAWLDRTLGGKGLGDVTCLFGFCLGRLRGPLTEAEILEYVRLMLKAVGGRERV